MTLPAGARAYLVGGAVRDRLLGIRGGDRDYVVVGATPEAMVAAGLRPVGADFPVFIEPTSGAEYALARTERKSGRGYKGFVFHAAPDVTLDADLARRDLTINAIAEDAGGALIDPFGGVRDIAARVLRHVSPAFVEDPLRVLRVARFAARFVTHGFTVAPETRALMQAIVAAGELDHLVPERVWQEIRKALAARRPGTFVRTLREVGALAVLLPEVDALYGTPQRPEFHPEIDAGLHTEMVLDAAARLAAGDALIGYAALTHDLGKGTTPINALPRHIAHETRGVSLVDAVSARLKVPNEFAALARIACRHHLEVHRAFELKPATLVELFERIDAFRRPERLGHLLRVCEADKRGRLGLGGADYPQAHYLQRCFAAAASVDTAPLIAAGLGGIAFGDGIRRARVAAVATVRRDSA